MSDDSTLLTGRCMCGVVELSTDAPFLGALFCHCRRCQRRSGTTRSIPDRYWCLSTIWAVFGALATLLPLANLYFMVFKPA